MIDYSMLTECTGVSAIPHNHSEDIDDLWDGLNLGGLLNDLQRENDELVRARKKQDPFKKHNKVVQSPAYTAIMNRYQTKPARPKIMAKRTLERLADPVKGRHESPKKEDINKRQSRPPRKESRASAMLGANGRKSKPEYHSPLREKDEFDRRPSPITSPRKIITSRREETGSTFLTGLLHGESDDEPDDYSHTMDVRVDFSKGRDMYEIYSPRTRQYMKDVEMEAHQEELLREVKLPSPPKQQQHDQSYRDSVDQCRVSATRAKKGSCNKKTTAQKSKAKSKPKPKIGVDKKRSNAVTASGGGGVSSRAVGKNPTRSMPATGIRATRKTGQRQRASGVVMDPLLGLERVDSNARGGSNTLLRSSSGVGHRASRQLSGKSTSGTRSAPNISKSKVGRIEEDSAEELVFRRPPISNAKRLLGRVSGSKTSSKLYGDKLQRSGLGNVKLQPILKGNPTADAFPQISTKASHSRRKPPLVASERNAANHQIPVHRGINTPRNDMLKSHSKPPSTVKIEPSDDQLSAMFAAHAKKMSASLQRADSLNSQYKHLRDFDGYLYASRHNMDSMIPKSADRSTRPIEGSSDVKTSPVVQPEKKNLKIVI